MNIDFPSKKDVTHNSRAIFSLNAYINTEINHFNMFFHQFYLTTEKKKIVTRCAHTMNDFHSILKIDEI